MYLKNIRFKAVAAGMIIDIAGSIAVGFAIVIYIAVVASNSGDTSLAHFTILKDNVYLRLLGLLGTIFFTGLGGYVAARLSRPNGLCNSLAVGLLGILLGTVLFISMPGIAPKWKFTLGVILTIPAALIGGRIATRS